MSQPSVRPSWLPRGRVLVVDDDEATARLLARFLREYEVTIAHDGDEGLSRAREVRPDVIVTDVWMPRLDGLEMIARLRADPAMPHVPVIFLTAAGDAEHVARGIAVGARHWLPKPIQIEKLLSLVQRALASGVASMP